MQHNAFSLSLAEVAFAKAVTPESRVGFRADLDFGKTADLVAAYEPEDDGKEIYKHIQQAYVSLLTGKVHLGRGQVRDPHRGRGHRVAGQLELHPLDPLRLRDPLLPHGCAGHGGRDRQGVLHRVRGERLEQQRARSTATRPFALNATLKPSAKFTWYLNYMVGKETTRA